MSLVGGDTMRIIGMFKLAQFYWLTPLLIITSFFHVYAFMGLLPALAGFTLLFFSVPISTILTRKLQRVVKASSELTDARSKAANEIVHSIKTVKIYALEEHFSKAADEARARELDQRRRVQYWKAFQACVNDSTIPFISLVTFLTFILRGGILTPSTAFSVMSMYASLHWPFQMITTTLIGTVDLLVAIRRL